MGGGGGGGGGGRHFGGPYNKDYGTLRNLKVLKELWAEVGSGMGLGLGFGVAIDLRRKSQ